MERYAEIVDMLKKTYCFYRQKYVFMTAKYTKTVPHYYKDPVIESHLGGYYALAVFAGEKVTRFITADIDAGGKAAVRKVMDAFAELGIPRDRMYVSTSGKKGYHVDIFFSPWIYNEKAKNLYDLMIWRSGLDPKKVEFRPTNRQAVKIPLGLHATTRNRCWFLDRDTLEPIEDMGFIKSIMPVQADEILPMLKEWNKRRWNELYAEMVCNNSGKDDTIVKDINFDTSYYESKTLTQPGTRHDTMLEIAHDLRTYGANKHQIAKALRGFYYRQDPAMIESAERIVLDDIEEIAEWAEENVIVTRYRQVSNSAEPKRYKIDKYDISAILMAPTDAARRVAFLIYAYCKMFGAAHISYEKIAEDTGCSSASAKNAIKVLVERRIVNRESGGCHYKNGSLIRKANTYFIPKNHIFGCPPEESLVAEEIEVSEKITQETFLPIYYGVLRGLCKPEYIKNYMTKPEFARVMEEDAV